MKDMKAKWQEHERKWMQHERRWKEMKTTDDICWLSTKDAFTPTESWKITLLVYRELTTWEHDKSKKKKTTTWFWVISKDTRFLCNPKRVQQRPRKSVLQESPSSRSPKSVWQCAKSVSQQCPAGASHSGVLQACLARNAPQDWHCLPQVNACCCFRKEFCFTTVVLFGC